MEEEARSPSQPPAHPSRPPTPPSSDHQVLPFPPPPPYAVIVTFFKIENNHSQADFAGTEINIPWYLIYIWRKDANLRELTEGIKKYFPYLRENGQNTRLYFARVFTNEHGIREIRRLGRTMCFEEERLDDLVQLLQAGFQIGDYLDVAIRYPPGLMIAERRALTSSLFPH